ncbi:uncharacterized protein EV154DRAFT_608315 [Mucor mucedo]|uniref:uncharacterized protein n=1 Tax=Mucor mucedo TaxID=29922 RepID=UPI00221F3C42|nr:uncharacterized protein EV154DRAFT_608315 [Mucor mucedo]KAI7864379.1 hypothetical protein EV154DRAFT_608315 [Mucor mucedo]
MGKSKIALWREMEQFKRQMLLNPGYELTESEIASFQPSPPPRRQPRQKAQAPSYDPMSEYPADDDNNTTVVLHNCTMDPTPAPAPRKRRRIRIRSSVPIVKAVPAKVSPAEAKKERAIRYQRKLEVLANKWGKVLNNMCVNYLVFVGQQGGLPSTEIVSPVAIDCQCGSEKVLLTKTVRMYFFHAIKDVSVSYCSCKPLAEALILMGMFPASPTDPKNAIHLGLLGYFNEVRNTLKSSSEGITKLYNKLQGNPLTSLSVNNFRTVFNMYNKVILLTDEMVNERSLLKDQAMCCPACPSRDSINPMDRIFITMDGCFSMKSTHYPNGYFRDSKPGCDIDRTRCHVCSREFSSPSNRNKHALRFHNTPTPANVGRPSLGGRKQANHRYYKKSTTEQVRPKCALLLTSAREEFTALDKGFSLALYRTYLKQ